MIIGKIGVAAFMLASLSGCAAFAKCGFNGCAGDAELTKQVEATLRQHPDIEQWNVDVQTLDKVVYLHGLVGTNVERSHIEELAHATPGVEHVVDSIEIAND